MYGKRKSIFKSLLTAVVILLVIALAVGLIFKYTKAGDRIRDLVNPAFRIEYDGKNYEGKNNVIALPAEGQARFKVKGAESYKVMLTPNVTSETDFEYETNDGLYRYSQTDLSKVFTYTVKNGILYFNCLEDYSLESVLSKLHGGADIKLSDNLECPYRLTFMADNTTVSFVFSCEIRIVLPNNNIVF